MDTFEIVSPDFRLRVMTRQVPREEVRSLAACYNDQSGPQYAYESLTVPDREITETLIAPSSGPGAWHPHRLADRFCL
jgi:hypothetical protein